jgi:hypothetical protein
VAEITKLVNGQVEENPAPPTQPTATAPDPQSNGQPTGGNGSLPPEVLAYPWPPGSTAVKMKHYLGDGTPEWWYAYFRKDHPKMVGIDFVHPQSAVKMRGASVKRENVFLLDGSPLPPHEPPGKKKKKRKKKEDTKPKSATPVDLSDLERLTNYSGVVDSDGNGLPAQSFQIIEELLEIADGWPRRVGNRLFAQSEDFRPIYLDSAAKLFGWVSRFAQVCWNYESTKGFMPREDFLHYLQHLERLDSYDAIEATPHWPPREDLYYMHPDIPGRNNTEYLDGLLDFFRPATDIDRELIKSFVLTMYWGGAPGERPLFVFSGEDDDEDDGIGIGKSKLVAMLADLVGGLIDLGLREEMDHFKSRLLSSEHGLKRVIRADNVKSERWSWDEFEALVTSSVISGRANNRGEQQMPNLKVYAVTMNGGTLSKDMASRSVRIFLKRPEPDGTWESRLRAYVAAHKWEIAAECMYLLKNDNDEPVNLSYGNRWGPWTTEVLSKVVSDVKKAQETFLGRQGQYDGDTSESLDFEDYLKKELDRMSYPVKGRILISGFHMSEFISDYEGKDMNPHKTGMAIGRMKGLSRLGKRRTEGERLYEWDGRDSDKAKDDDEVTTYTGYDLTTYRFWVPSRRRRFPQPAAADS